jgi:hypothetical protein
VSGIDHHFTFARQIELLPSMTLRLLGLPPPLVTFLFSQFCWLSLLSHNYSGNSPWIFSLLSTSCFSVACLHSDSKSCMQTGQSLCLWIHKSSSFLTTLVDQMELSILILLPWFRVFCIFFFFSSFFGSTGIWFRTSHLLGKHSTLDSCPQTFLL